ncbi:MAG: FkbM family methyltransferase [Chitinophagaceae bacterium]
MKRILRPDSNCIDIGCHSGKILDRILTLAPEGSHWAFEPLPDLYQRLRQKYANRRVTVSPFALSDTEGGSAFKHVKNSPGYSGFRKRTYHIPFPHIEEITVQKKRLDNILPADYRADLIKLDVEGAELEVLRGARETILRNKPVIIFEHGIGAAPFYHTTPGDIHDLLTSYGLKIFTLKDWLNRKPALDKTVFANQFRTEKNYYFIASA